MKVYGRAAVSEFLGDRIVYRNLTPADPNLPGLADLRQQVGLPPERIPRKNEVDYARVIVHLLQAARRQTAPGTRLQRLIFVGDTRMSDATAFDNLCREGGWTGLAFIGAETRHALAVEIAHTASGQHLFLANRWAQLMNHTGVEKVDPFVSFAGFCAAQAFPIDAATAVVVDLDKTALGARGRNAHTIDAARVQAVKETVAGVLGAGFNQASFQQAYDLLNQPEFHSFTADNQDYLAYICLVLGSGLYKLEEVVAQVRAGRLVTFAEFIRRVDEQRQTLGTGLVDIHTQIYANVQAGDPTPFKAFRRNEYRLTVGKMGYLPDDTPLETLLKDEIVLTQEVRQAALTWQAQGALLFGLSDKPDEASLPTPELAAQGYVPIHRQETHVIGSV